jgi:hypothetical protein
MFRIAETFERTLAIDLAGRVLHLVDVENLVGSAAFSTCEAAWARSAYERVAPMGSVNQMVIATSHHAAPSTWFAWPANARRLLRSGPDGADLALLELVERESIAFRFQHVVIGSGDGIFALPAAGLHAAGCGVTIVTRRAALSRQLGLAARDVRFIDAAAPELAIELSVA